MATSVAGIEQTMWGEERLDDLAMRMNAAV
jgi:hypothetical protein